MTETLKDEWLKNPGKNIMAGIVVDRKSVV